jgi:hypothetical protein
MNPTINKNMPEAVVYSTLSPGTLAEATDEMVCKTPCGDNEIYIITDDGQICNTRTGDVRTPIVKFMVYELEQEVPLMTGYKKR